MKIFHEKLLLVDDEPYNLEILVDILENVGYKTKTANNGMEAWNILGKKDEEFSLILLDRMMPKMDGMGLLKLIRKDPTFYNLPIIFQTALASKNEILIGLKAGVYHYLTKPFERDTLLAIIKSALSSYNKYKKLHDDVKKITNTARLMTSGDFIFTTIDEGNSLAIMLAGNCNESNKLVVGLSELLTNAVEHGNLGISYNDKTLFNEKLNLQEEVCRRLKLPENRSKKVHVHVERNDKEIKILIHDDGNGFNWKKYKQIKAERAFDSHGRGIFIAAKILDKLDYSKKGNEVVATFKLTH